MQVCVKTKFSFLKLSEFCFPSIFDQWLVGSTDAESMDTKGQLYTTPADDSLWENSEDARLTKVIMIVLVREALEYWESPWDKSCWYDILSQNWVPW